LTKEIYIDAVNQKRPSTPVVRPDTPHPEFEEEVAETAAPEKPDDAPATQNSNSDVEIKKLAEKCTA